MVKRGFDFKRRDHNFIIDADMVLRVTYHGSRGVRSGIWPRALGKKGGLANMRQSRFYHFLGKYRQIMKKNVTAK